MLLAYIDESKNDTSLAITALIVPGGEAAALGAALDQGVEALSWSKTGVRSDAELHGHAIVHAKEDWTGLKSDLATRIAIYERAIEIIALHNVCFYIRGANLGYHLDRYGPDKDPYVTVLPWVLEYVQGEASANHDHALVIADEVARTDHHRRAFRDYQRYSTAGWKAQKLDLIVDTIHFAPSKASRLLQAADLIAYAHGQVQRTNNDPRAEAVWTRIWDKLGPARRTVSIWTRP